MKKFLFLLTFLFALAVGAQAQTNCVELREIDGTPDVKCVKIIKVTNGTLACTGNTCTITISGGGGGSPGGADTNVQYNNSGSFGGAAGFIFDGTSKVSLGVAGTSVGAVAFRNATSGTITVQPVTGALGTVTLSLPATTGTLALTSQLTSGTVTSVAQSFTGGLISVGGSPITTSGTLALTVAGTSGGIPYFSSGTTWATSAALAANALVIGGGAGTAPSTTTTGTGVLTALGTNVGSAGAFVTFNGAGGTPSSLTLTNATGLPPTTGISGWPDNASGVLTNNGSGTLSWAAAGSGITIDSTAITSGKSHRVLFESATNNVSEAAGFTFDGTSALTLGVEGTSVGSVAFKNATSGTITVSPVTGALGTVTLSLPATTSTLAGLAIAQTFSAAQSFSSTITQTSASATAFESGPNGGTNPVFRLVNSTASSATGLSITGKAAGSGVLLTALSSGSNEDLLLVGKGTGHVGSNKNGGVAIGVQVSGQSFVGIGRNGSIGGMNLNGGNSDADTAAQMNIGTLGVIMDGTFLFGWASTNVTQTRDLTLRRSAAANLAFGAADAASPVAQTLSVQNVVGGTTNTAGATWTHQASLGTSQGAPGRYHVTGGAMIAASGSTQQTAVDRLIVGATKVLTNNSATTIVNVTDAAGTSTGGVLDYCIEVTDGTDTQYECGSATYGISNKAGAFSGNTVTKFGNQQNATSGTLTVTFAISGANPGALSINANSSLTPSTGYPRVVYSLRNLGNQAVSIQ